MHIRGAIAIGGAGTALAVLLAGCSAHVPPPPPPVGLASTLPRVALLPLENLSARPDASEHLSRAVVGVLGETGMCQPVAPGDVEAAFTEFRIRDISGVTRDAMRQLGHRLDADWLMAGTILEYGSVRSPEGEVPSVGLTLRLYEAGTGRTAWTAMRVHTGEDRETLFGMGRVRSLDQLSEIVVRELLRGFRLPARADSLPLRGGS
jgi:hypothetical protein